MELKGVLLRHALLMRVVHAREAKQEFTVAQNIRRFRRAQKFSKCRL